VTQACGTGACAALVAGVIGGRLGREATMRVLGGELRVRWDEQSNHVFMTGEAVDVFEGVWPEEREAQASGEGSWPTLRTDRLVLRPFVMEDAPDVSRLAGDKRVVLHTLTMPHPYEVHHATAWIAMHKRLRAEGTGVVFAICDGATGALMGAIGLVIDKTHPRAELGYWIGVPFWGRGYATEAARAMLAHGFRDLKLPRIFACYYAANPSSGRVLEKIGMKREGVSPRHVTRFGTVHDQVHFGMLREDWLAAQ
jgi:RimJ/RimL family protein N-acetyltransferase